VRLRTNDEIGIEERWSSFGFLDARGTGRCQDSLDEGETGESMGDKLGEEASDYRRVSENPETILSVILTNAGLDAESESSFKSVGRLGRRP
jgi:hypothetical protein